MHARITPARNAFRYGIYYVALPLSELDNCDITQERFAVTSFSNKDHGPGDGSPLFPWGKNILSQYGINEADGEIVLVCMPRILGYGYNPVSFWLCYDKQENLRAVLCDVHNTFGERHCYLCARNDHQPLQNNDRLVAEKIFHVSPFLKREGHYEFTFNIKNEKFDVRIDYFDGAGTKTLVTSLTGSFSPLTKTDLHKAFWTHPLVTMKAITLIHWQAIKIISKGIRYIRKPPQKDERSSVTGNITKI